MAVDRDRYRARVIEVAGGSSTATVTNHSRIASAAATSRYRPALLGSLDSHASRGARTALQCAAHGERSAGLRTGKGVSGFIHFHQPPQAVHAGAALFAGFVRGLRAIAWDRNGGNYVVIHVADAAVLLRRLRDAIQRVIFVCRNAVGGIAG